MIKLSSGQPRVSLFLVKGTVHFSTISAQSISFRSSRSHSACGICRNFPQNNGATNKLILPTMSRCSVVRFHTLCYKEVGSLSSGRQRGGDKRRGTISTAAPLISRPAPLVVHYPSSSLLLSAHLTPSEAPQRSDEWFALRKDKLTTSTFSTALGFWKGSRRFELWHEKVYASGSKIVEGPQRCAMDWGVRNEATAIERYKTITGREVSSMSFATHSEEKFDWIGASPDGLLGSLPAGGILEVKCPYNKGKPETALPWDKMPFYYMPQVQGQMEVMDREWVDLYCWTPNGSTIFRVCRARVYWDLIHGILREFWWENVIPARESLAMGKEEEETKSYKPASTHKLTGLAIAKSIELAGQAKLICREIAGHVEFFR